MSSRSKVIRPSFFFFGGDAEVTDEAFSSVVEWRGWMIRSAGVCMGVTLMSSMTRMEAPPRVGMNPEECCVDSAATRAPVAV